MTTPERPSAEDAPRRLARCGADFDHDWHGYRNPGDDRRHVCDGQTRPTPPGSGGAR